MTINDYTDEVKTMNIGEIIRDDGGKVSGYVAEAGFDFRIFFAKVDSDNPRAPAFNMMTKSPRGREVRLGSVWERSARDTGEVYFGGYIDTTQSGFVPIRIFQSRQDNRVWSVVRQTARRQRERDAIDLPAPVVADEGEAPRRTQRRRAAPGDELPAA